MIKKLLLMLLLCWCGRLLAQSVKTDVLIIGSGPAAVATAIQCARSKVKTMLAAQSIRLTFKAEKAVIPENRNIPSGLWGEFSKHVRDLNKAAAGADTAYNAPLTFEKNAGELILQKMTDTVKNLTVDLNTSFTGIKKDGDRWQVHLLRDGKDIEIKARVVVDATESEAVAEKTRAKFKALGNPQLNYQTTSYRTAIAAGNNWPGGKPATNAACCYWSIPIDALLTGGPDNLLVTEGILPAEKDAGCLPVQLQLGQGAGAIAAYCAFYKTSTKNLKVRSIQGELLDFKGYLVPFTDIRQNDPDWRAIQQVGATGLLKGENKAGTFVFMPDEPVITAGIEPVLKEIYTRAFLWFNREKPGEKFTVGNTISFISDYTLTDPAVLKAAIQKAWKVNFKFKPDFDLNRAITRREFAVLANKYLNPFARTVDLRGRLVN